MKARLVLLTLTAILLTMAGCKTDDPGFTRPDGTDVPMPGYNTNVVPWVYTNGVSK